MNKLDSILEIMKETTELIEKFNSGEIGIKELKEFADSKQEELKKIESFYEKS